MTETSSTVRSDDSAYFDYYFSRGRTFSIAHYESLRPTFRRYFGAALPSDRDAAIADVACGCGEFLYFLRHEGYSNLAGVDALAAHVERARRATSVDVTVADGVDWIGGYAGAFDLVSAHDFLEHLSPEDVGPFLAAVRRALKPRGTLIVSTPNASSPFGGRSRYCDFTHRTSFTAASLRHVLLAAGFADVTIRPKGPVVHGVTSAVRWAAWKAIEQLLRMFMLIETGAVGGEVFTQVMFAVARNTDA